MIKTFHLKFMTAFFMAFICLTAAAEIEQADVSGINDRLRVSLSKQELQWLEEHPVIKVVHDPGWPPIEFTDEQGEASGMSADYIALVEERLGIKFKRVKNLSWQSAVEGLKRRDIDMVTSVSVTPARSEYLNFTKPYMDNPVVIAAGMDVTYIGGMHELKGKTVAVVDGYATDDWLTRDHPEIKIIRVKTALDGLELLQRGEIFAYIDSLLIIGYYQSKMKVSSIKVAGQTPYVFAQCIGVRKDWTPLTGIVQKALDSISENEKEIIYRKWLPLRYEYGFNYVLLWKISGVFIFLLLVLVLWNWKLSREIKFRKQAEIKIQNLLKEKDMLLVEVHNRIKNNMNSIKGLVTLHIASESNSSVISSLRDLECRIQSMITLYDRLYFNQNYRELPVSNYLKSLITEITGSFANSNTIKVETEMENFILNVNLLTPLGIIINELLTNIMKYAFIDKNFGLIKVSAAINDGMAVIIVHDNGAGIPESFTIGTSTGFGLDLVKLLVDQINGSIRFERVDGTKAILEFPVT